MPNHDNDEQEDGSIFFPKPKQTDLYFALPKGVHGPPVPVYVKSIDSPALPKPKPVKPPEFNWQSYGPLGGPATETRRSLLNQPDTRDIVTRGFDALPGLVSNKGTRALLRMAQPGMPLFSQKAEPVTDVAASFLTPQVPEDFEQTSYLFGKVPISGPVNLAFQAGGLMTAAPLAGQVARSVGRTALLRQTPFEIRAGRRLPHLAGGAQPTVGPLSNFDETVRVATQPSFRRSVANLQVGSVKPFEAISRFGAGKAAAPRNEAELAIIGRQVLDEEIAAKTTGAAMTLRAVGDEQALFGKWKAESAGILEGPLKGQSINDIAADPAKFAKLAPQQQRWIQAASEQVEAVARMMVEEGLDVPRLKIPQGGYYLPRRVLAKVDAAGEIVEEGAVGVGRKRVGALPGNVKPRQFKNEQEAFKAGYRYLPQSEAVRTYVQQGLKRIADKKMADWLLDSLGEGRWRTAKGKANPALEAAQVRYDKAQKFVDVLQRARRGEILTTGTINSLEREFVGIKDKLTDATRLWYENVLAAAKKGAEPDRVLKVPTAGTFAWYDKHIAEAISNGDKARAELLEKQRAFAKYRYAVAEDIAAGGKVPEGFNSNGEAVIKPNFVKALMSGIEPTNKAATQARLGVNREQALQELLEVARGKKSVDAKGKVTYQGGVLQDAQDKLRALKKEEAAASAKRRKSAWDEATVQHPAFQGKFFEKDIADTLNKYARSGDVSTLGKIAAAASAPMRMFALAGDASQNTIQLALMAFAHPTDYAPAFYQGFKALVSPSAASRYMAIPENAIQIQQSRVMILARGGATEFTDPLRGGILGTMGRMPILKYPVLALKPFQRGFETTLDVAGVEMRKSLVKPWHTAEEVTAIEQHINLMRGVTSTAKLGLSAEQQAWESAVLLAPRYFRSQGVLMANLLNGGMTGQMARRDVAYGLVGIHASFIGIDMAISAAQGKSMEEWEASLKRKMDPTSGEYLTWEIAGQRVGPGPKVRQFIQTAARIYDEPDKFLEWSRENPALRFAESQLAAGPVTAINVVRGENFVGEPTTDGWLNFSENVLAPNLMPLWLQSAAFDGGTLVQRAIRGGGGFGGLRERPATRSEALNTFVTDLVVDAKGKAVPPTDSARVFQWEDLSPSGKGRLKQTGDYEEIAEHYRKDNVDQRITDARKKDLEDQRVNDTALDTGEITGEEWRNRYYELQRRISVRSDAQDMVGALRKGELKTENDRALAGYYELAEKFELPGGNFNFDKYRAATENYLAGLPPPQRQYVMEELHPNATPKVRMFNEHKTIAKDLKWDAFEEYVMPQSGLPITIQQTYLQAKKADREGRLQAYLEVEMPGETAGGLSAYRKIDAYVDAVRVIFRQAHPELDTGLARFYDKAPVTKESRRAVYPALPQVRQFRALATAAGEHVTEAQQSALQDAGIDMQDLAGATPEAIWEIFEQYLAGRQSMPKTADIVLWIQQAKEIVG